MAARSDVFIGDLLEALHRLDVRTPAEARQVMQMLGLDSWAPLAAASPVAAPPAPAPAGPPAGPAAAPPTALPTMLAPGQAAAVPALAADAATQEQAQVQPLPPRAPGLLPPWHGATALPRARRGVSPPAAPLFAPLKSRALLAALAATHAADGGLDLDRLVQQLAAGRLPSPLPQARAWRLAGGLQVLVDDGATMAPWAEDIAGLRQRLAGLLAPDRITWLRFQGTPLHGVRQAGRRGRRPWQPPPAGQAVLLVSELGLAPADPLDGGASRQDWLAFAAQARQAGLSLRSLVPWPAQRVPRALAQVLHPVTWDRSTTVGMVRRQVARAPQPGGW